MSALEIMIGVRSLLADEKHWTKGAWAREEDGAECSHSAPNAVCWCLGGALIHVARLACDMAGMIEARQKLCVAAGTSAWLRMGLVTANDDLDHAGVLALIDRAIAQERSHAA